MFDYLRPYAIEIIQEIELFVFSEKFNESKVWEDGWRITYDSI